jgi:hypothetical protein
VGSERTEVIELLGDPKQVVGQTPDHVERVLDCPLGQPQRNYAIVPQRRA